MIWVELWPNGEPHQVPDGTSGAIPVNRPFGPPMDTGAVTICGLGGAACPWGLKHPDAPYCVVPHAALIAQRQAEADYEAAVDAKIRTQAAAALASEGIYPP